MNEKQLSKLIEKIEVFRAEVNKKLDEKANQKDMVRVINYIENNDKRQKITEERKLLVDNQSKRLNRINRGSFALSYLTVPLFAIVIGLEGDFLLYRALNTDFTTYKYGLPLTAILLLFATFYQIWVGVFRLHDRSRSGWEMILALIPIVGLIVILPNFFEKGTQGQNRFGSPQKKVRLYLPFDKD